MIGFGLTLDFQKSPLSCLFSAHRSVASRPNIFCLTYSTPLLSLTYSTPLLSLTYSTLKFVRLTCGVSAECYRKLSVVALWASTKWLTPKCKQQAEPAKSVKRKKCDHVCSPFRFDKQSHVTVIVDILHHNQLPHFSSNSPFTCFGSTPSLLLKDSK